MIKGWRTVLRRFLSDLFFDSLSKAILFRLVWRYNDVSDCRPWKSGEQYEHTRHNVGFMALDEIAYKLCTKLDKIKFKGVLGEGRCNGKSVIVKTAYLHEFVRSKCKRCRQFKIDIDKIIVIYDDIDLNLGN